MVVVRNAVMEDAERILEIYDYYVKNTAITFEYDTPSLNEFKERMEKTMQRYPYLVILKDGHIDKSLTDHSEISVERVCGP